MLIYLDMCCLKRPFDDQSQSRVRLESEAVLSLLALESSDVRFVRSPALLLENSRNPVKERASRVGQWLLSESTLASELDSKALEARMAELMRLGLKNFDALHVATAEQVRADVMATCDDRLIAAARRGGGRVMVRVIGVIELAEEILK